MYSLLLTRDSLCVVVCWILAYEKHRDKTHALQSIGTFILYLRLCGAPLEGLNASKINGRHGTYPVELKSSWQRTLLRQAACLWDCKNATLIKGHPSSGWPCIVDSWTSGVLQGCAAFMIMLRPGGAAGWVRGSLWRVWSASEGVYGLQPPLQPCIALLQALLLLLPPPLRSIKLWDEDLHVHLCKSLLPLKAAKQLHLQQSSVAL